MPRRVHATPTVPPYLPFSHRGQQRPPFVSRHVRRVNGAKGKERGKREKEEKGRRKEGKREKRKNSKLKTGKGNKRERKKGGTGKRN